MADKVKKTPADKGSQDTITQEQISAWKEEHGKVFRVTVESLEDGGEPHTCYLKKPSRKTLQAAMAAADSVKTNEILLANCWLGGDETIRTNDDLFLSASAKLGSLFNIREAEIKEL